MVLFLFYVHVDCVDAVVCWLLKLLCLLRVAAAVVGACCWWLVWLCIDVVCYCC